MSYCPADGRILGEATGGIKPETPEGINRAVQAAKVAQVEWAKTTFAERRKVLKTLLKYVPYGIATTRSRRGWNADRCTRAI